MALLLEQVPGSYNFTYNYLDDTNPTFPLKVEIYDDYFGTLLETNTDKNQDEEYSYLSGTEPKQYWVQIYLFDGTDWVSTYGTDFTTLEYKPQVDWNWTSAIGDDPGGSIVVSGITNAGDGYIQGIMGWGDPAGTKWSDLNGTYIRTSVAVRPSTGSFDNAGMSTPAAGTYNYYLQNPISMGSPNSDWNGIAYFLAPGNKTQFNTSIDNVDNGDITSVNYWRLCVGADYPATYFTNPSTDPTVFPTTGWVPVDIDATNFEGGWIDLETYLPNYGEGFTINTTSTVLEPATSYTYNPSLLILNNTLCVTGGYAPLISYTLYNLINGLWVDESPVTYSLDSWDDEDPDLNSISFGFTSTGYPIKIVTTLRNCNEEIIYNTLQKEGLITVSGNQTTHSESQDPASYTIKFAFEYLDPTEPNLIITPENNVRCDVYIYKNNEIIDIHQDLLPGEFYPYTFSEPTSPNAAYKVVYKAINPDINLEESLEVPFTVREYKPSFTLPNITCLQINENASILLQNLNFNCFNDDEDLHILPASPENNPNIRYSLYYLNPNTYVWELQGSVSDTPNLFEDAIDYANAYPAENDLFVSEYLRTKYYYGSLDTEKGLWAPEKLTMVKLVVAVTNYTTTVTKEVIFPICGTWKIRRLACGKYRLYNYKGDTIAYDLYNDLSLTALPYVTNIAVPAFSFIDLPLPIDGIYKIVADGITQYIFNFCEVEACVLSLQKQILLDDSLCDTCKMDKALYQKALRLIPIYETWKKLLDKDNVYDMQYLSTDANGELAQLYDAQELYEEIRKLCADCGDSTSKKCNC